MVSLALAAGVFAAQSPAMAQTSSDTFTDAFAETVVFNPATVNVTNLTNFSTQIIGRLAGGAALYNQTFGAAFADPVVQAGVTAARLAISAAGGPGVIIGAPVLTASSSTTTTVSSTTYSLASVADTVRTDILFGPGTTQIGQLSVCTGVAGLPSATRPACGPGAPVTYVAGFDETNFNTVTTKTFTVDQNTQTTNTTTTSEQYTITGVVQALGQVHTLATSAIAEQGERFMRRLLGAGSDDGENNTPPPIMSYAPIQSAQSPSPFGPMPGVMAYAPQASGQPTGTVSRPGFTGWLNGFGWQGHRSASGGIPGDRRQAYGMEGGFGVDVTNNLRLGVGLDYAQLDIRLRGGGESAKINLAQAGVFAGWRNGPWYITGAATVGFADAATTVIAPGGLGTSIGSYDAKTFGFAGEAGYRFGLNGWTLTPHVGADWRRVRLSSFVETGALAIQTPGGSFDRSKLWAGLNLATKYALNGMTLSVSGFARVAGYSHGNDSLPVTFVAAPGVPLSLSTPKLGSTGAEAGFTTALAITPNAEVFAGYELRLRDKLVMHTGMGGLRVRW